MTKLFKVLKIIAVTFMAAIAALVILLLSVPDSPEQELADIQGDFEASLVRSALVAVESSLRNPDSFEVRQVIVVNGIDVCMTYAAQNGFGGMNVERIAFAGGEVANYGDTCSGKSGTDYTRYF